MSRLGLSLFLCAALAAAGTPAIAQSSELGVLEIDGVERSYLVFVPADSGGGAATGDAAPTDVVAPAGNGAPLLFVLHGRGGSGASMVETTGFNELAAAAGAVVVYPDGMSGQWNYLAGLGGNDGANDPKFLETLAGEIAGLYPIDPKRVYVAGYSNGGFMAQRLACEPDSPFAGFASIAAAGFGGMPELCREPAPLSLMLVNGTSDSVVPWSGRTGVIEGRELLLSASVPQTFAFWANHAGCGGASERRRIPLAGPTPERVEILSVTDCPAESEVVLYAVVGGRHDWPRLDGPGSAQAGSVGFDASAEVWKFFEAGR